MTCPVDSWTHQDGSLRTFLTNLFQYFTTVTIKKIKIYLTWIFDIVSIASHSHAPPRQVWLHFLRVLQQAAVDRVSSVPLSFPPQAELILFSVPLLLLAPSSRPLTSPTAGSQHLSCSGHLKTQQSVPGTAWQVLNRGKSLFPGIHHCFLAQQPPARYLVGITWSYPMPDTGLQFYFLGTSGGSCVPISPGCPEPAE